VTTSPLKSTGKYRRHYFDIGLFDEKHKLIGKISVTTKGEEKTVVNVEGMKYANFLPNYSNLGYFYVELSEEQIRFFTDDDSFGDYNTMATFNQYYYLSVLQGDTPLVDYLNFATELIAAQPKEWLFVLTSHAYLGNLLSLTEGINNDMIKQKVYDTLSKITWSSRDLTCLEAMITFAYKGKFNPINKPLLEKGKFADLYLLMFKNEKMEFLRENLSVNSLTRWCTTLIKSGELKKDQVQDLTAR